MHWRVCNVEMHHLLVAIAAAAASHTQSPAFFTMPVPSWVASFVDEKTPRLPCQILLAITVQGWLGEINMQVWVI